jgi:hypothetical protein
MTLGSRSKRTTSHTENKTRPRLLRQAAVGKVKVSGLNKSSGSELALKLGFALDGKQYHHYRPQRESRALQSSSNPSRQGDSGFPKTFSKKFGKMLDKLR